MIRARAQGIAEYALIILFVVLVAAVALAFLGNNLGNLLNDIGKAFSNCKPGTIGTRPNC